MAGLQDAGEVDLSALRVPAGQGLFVVVRAGSAVDPAEREGPSEVARSSQQETSPLDEIAALRFAGEWRNPQPLATLNPDSVIPREGCAVLLRREGPALFVGSTMGRECTRSLQGATYATTDARISENRFDSWDRGFNQADEQVWGSTSGGYVFRRNGG